MTKERIAKLKAELKLLRANAQSIDRDFAKLDKAFARADEKLGKESTSTWNKIDKIEALLVDAEEAENAEANE